MVKSSLNCTIAWLENVYIDLNIQHRFNHILYLLQIEKSKVNHYAEQAISNQDLTENKMRPDSSEPTSLKIR